MKEARNCSVNTKKIIQIFLSPPEIGICDNFSEFLKP